MATSDQLILISVLNEQLPVSHTHTVTVLAPPILLTDTNTDNGVHAHHLRSSLGPP